jgi:hypothetical protein
MDNVQNIAHLDTSPEKINSLTRNMTCRNSTVTIRTILEEFNT